MRTSLLIVVVLALTSSTGFAGKILLTKKNEECLLRHFTPTEKRTIWRWANTTFWRYTYSADGLVQRKCNKIKGNLVVSFIKLCQVAKYILSFGFWLHVVFPYKQQ